MAKQVEQPAPAAPPKTSTEAVTTAHVLFEEYQAIHGPDETVREPEVYYRRVYEKKQAALCLSGGGIRSAAFALGLIQALSREKLLTGFHYLSTVSGGGYMGSWLQRWIYQEGLELTEPAPRDARSRIAAAEAVMARLGDRDKEPDEVKHLRQNSNFLTPRVGLGSNDTWTAIAISVRNIAINWLLFTPLLLLVALLPNLFLEGVISIRGAVAWHPGVLYGLLGMTGVSIAWATAAMAPLLPSYRNDPPGEVVDAGKGDSLLLWRIVLPLILWSIFGTLALAVELLHPDKNPDLLYLFGEGGMDVAIVSLLGMFIGLMAAALRLGDDYVKTFDQDYWVWPGAFIVTSAWLLAGVSLFGQIPSYSPWAPIVLTAAGPLWFLTATLIGAIVFAAFRKSEGPTVRPDDDREWLARLSAVKLKPMIFWAVVASAVLLLNRLWGVAGESNLALPSLVTVLSGAAAVFGGRSAQTPAGGKGGGGSIMKYVPLSALLGLATLLFILALLMLFGRLEMILVTLIGKAIVLELGTDRGWLDPDVALHFAAALILIVLLWILSPKIPVNRFSLNAFYRNRLARGFLGAARPSRQADRFTGFDPADNIRLSKLATGPDERTILYPVINVALNVTASENLAWQERKAEPFVFTPQYCGSGMLSREGKPLARRTGAYVETSLYAGREPDIGMNEDTSLGAQAPLGVTLATATALSGAAAAPNMGYYSSSSTAFLMTLFNVRLGAWLPNPARAKELKEDISRGSPGNSLGPLFRELSGSTHDRGDDIYLSDGGHFENLALYEMVRRRCRYIVVSDAASDPACAFKDLGNAVRKIKIDLDVDIKFDELHISGRDSPLDEAQVQLAWALGEIIYPDKNEDGTPLTGQIIYLKPSFFGEGMPIDVIAYARGSQTFPHETTADQFFSESQFESYRRLAEHFAGDLLKKSRPRGSVARLFAAAQKVHVHAPTSDKDDGKAAAARPKARSPVGPEDPPAPPFPEGSG